MPERIERRQRSQQPGAGAAAVPGVMERGQRRGPLSECETGQHGGRAAGATERKHPARCCAAGVRGLGCRGCQHGRGGTLPVRFRSQSRSVRCFVRFAAAFPRAALQPREHLPEGVAAGGLLLLAGSAARASQRCRTRQRAAHPAQKERQSAGAEWCAGGPNDGHPAGARPKGYPPLSVEQSGSTRRKERGSAHRALPLVAFKSRPVDGRSGLELSPAPTGQSSIYRTRAAPWGDNTGVSPLYPVGLLHVVPGISGGFCAYLLIGPLHLLRCRGKVEPVFVVAVVLNEPLCCITKCCTFHIFSPLNIVFSRCLVLQAGYTSLERQGCSV